MIINPKKDRFKFLVEGSKGDEYTVTFRVDNGQLRAGCTCNAAENGMACKHRLWLLSGDDENLLSENIDDLDRVVALLPGTDLEAAMKEVRKLEDQLETVQYKLRLEKKRLSKVMIG